MDHIIKLGLLAGIVSLTFLVVAPLLLWSMGI